MQSPPEGGARTPAARVAVVSGTLCTCLSHEWQHVTGVLVTNMLVIVLVGALRSGGVGT